MSHGNMQMKHSLLSFHGKRKMTDAVFVIKSFIDRGGEGTGGSPLPPPKQKQQLQLPKFGDPNYNA